jgi:TolB-like protein/Flp pilus assembly protein TadD
MMTMKERKQQNSNDLNDPALVTAQVDRILAHQSFTDCVRSQQFLHYVVGETLQGRAGRIKGASIAQDVFHLEDPEQVQTSTVVRVEAGRLRRRLELYYATDGQTDPIRITIPKGSYVPSFELVTRQDEAKHSASATTSVQPSKRSRLPRVSLAYFAVVSLVILAAVLLWLLPLDHGTSQKTKAPNWGKPSIAVLPFEDLTNDPSEKGVAAGLTEDIITDLSRLSGIDVIALPSVLPYRERKASPQAIRTELGVSHVLYGSVRGTPKEMRVTAQLYQTQNGKQIWAERFDRELTNILMLQDELATNIVESISASFDAVDRSRSPSRSRPDPKSEAYALYKQALNLVNPPNDLGRLLSARRAFERVIQMVPEYAGGYAGAAYTHAFVAFWGRSKTPAEEIRLARELSDRALQLDGSFGLALSTQALVYLTQRNYEKARIASDQALQVQPNDPYVAIYHSAILLSSGQAQEGIEFARRSLRLDPLSPRTPYLNILGMAHFHAGEYREALAAMQRNIDRGGPFGAHIQAYVTAAYAQLGDTATAKEQLEILNMYTGDFSWENWLQRWHKDDKEAARVLEPIRALSAGL